MIKLEWNTDAADGRQWETFSDNDYNLALVRYGNLMGYPGCSNIVMSLTEESEPVVLYEDKMT